MSKEKPIVECILHVTLVSTAADVQVEKVLVKVIGKHKLHYWNLLDQLLLMS